MSARPAPGAARAPLAGGRWHFQHGPIDLVLRAWGDEAECARAYAQGWARFETVLAELVAELPLLRKPVVPANAGTHAGAETRARDQPPSGGEMGPRFRGDDKDCLLQGPVARRMWRACMPFAREFITPMAAVAGAVADEVLAAMTAGRDLRRAYVNNGGDIAIHLAPGERFETGIVGDLNKPKITATARIAAEDAVRGLATSGWRGRSFSRGIADSVTVLARDAAAADAAATMIANAVDADHPAVERRPARDLDPDSDLREHCVTVSVGALDCASRAAALAHGAYAARRRREAGLIEAAYLELQGQRIAVGGDEAPAAIPEKRMAWSLHA